jgi:Transglycosylase SLT domain
MRYGRFVLTIIATLIAVSTASFAYSDGAKPTPSLASSNLCIQAFTSAERRYGIPKHLMMAIANTESGRYNPQAGKVVPWPWTLNVEGVGSYHSTMHDAVTAIRRARARGQESIDVGCMQISLKHHPDAFVSDLDAVNPARNVEYAAKFLRSNYDELGSWPQAIAAYHSRTPSRGGAYYAKVRQRWQEVRSAAGGNMLENTDYMVKGVRVTRLPVQTAAAHTRNDNSEFEIALRQERDTPATPRIITRGDIKPAIRTVGSAPHRGESTMKVITVAARDVQDMRGAATVTMTPESKRNTAVSPEISEADFVPTPPVTNTAASEGPRWIFGRE